MARFSHRATTSAPEAEPHRDRYLDTASGAAVGGQIGRTSFVIAHRLSTIREADRIVVMEHGQIVEQGTHETLVFAGGAYERLYAAQFAGALA